MTEIRKSGRMQSIELLRFLFACVIVCFHLFHSNLLPFAGDSQSFADFAAVSNAQARVVDFFLLVGGFFLYGSSRQERPFAEAVLDRAARLWPVFAVYALLTQLTGQVPRSAFLMDLALLRCTGISLDAGGIVWYIGPYFWSCVILLAISRALPREKTALVLGALTCFGYAANINLTSGLYSREIGLGIFNLGMIRVLAGVSLGWLWAMFLESFQAAFPNARLGTGGATVLELGLLGFLGLRFFSGRLAAVTEQSFTFILIFMALIAVLRDGSGLFSRMCQRYGLGAWGKYAYGIYVMQQPVFDLLARTLWRRPGFVQNHLILCVVLSVACTAAAGAGAYWLIERPALAWYRRWKKGSGAAC